MKADELAHFLSETLTSRGFEFDELEDPKIFADRLAWVIHYRRSDCRIQICWSARHGGIDFMLAPPTSPKTFGLGDKSGTWKFMLLLSDAHDELITPALDADDIEIMQWLHTLFTAHFDTALENLRIGEV